MVVSRLKSPYVHIRVTKYPIKVLVISKSGDQSILFSHVLPVGTNVRDLDSLVCCLSRIYSNSYVKAFPLTPFLTPFLYEFEKACASC